MKFLVIEDSGDFSCYEADTIKEAVDFAFDPHYEHILGIIRLPDNIVKWLQDLAIQTKPTKNLKCSECQQDCPMRGCNIDACSFYKPPKEE